MKMGGKPVVKMPGGGMMKKKKAGQDHKDGTRRVGAYKKGSSNPRKEFMRVSNAEQHRLTSGNKSGKPRLAQELKKDTPMFMYGGKVFKDGGSLLGALMKDPKQRAKAKKMLGM